MSTPGPHPRWCFTKGSKPEFLDKTEVGPTLHRIESIQTEIRRRLSRIEEEEKIHIFYACESGSRAWGFPSRDSDYDVRFLYLRPLDWYLSIDVENRRDVVEGPVDGIYDINGWDLRKGLNLLYRSNPPLMEWLRSPIVYREDGDVAERLRELLPVYYSPRSAFYHYLHMARGNFRSYMTGEEVRQKKYFYILRPLLGIRWIEADRGPVPMEFDELVEATVDSAPLKGAIADLLEVKRSGGELDLGPRIPAISDFIEREIERLEGMDEGGVPPQRAEGSMEELNRLFREVVG